MMIRSGPKCSGGVGVMRQARVVLEASRGGVEREW